jgi:hypothetical protein
VGALERERVELRWDMDYAMILILKYYIFYSLFSVINAFLIIS